jgi:hypothetical protein
MTLQAIITLIGGKRATVFLLWALVATLALSVQSCRLNREQAKGSALKTDVANFNETQKGNLETIGELQHRLAVEATKREMEAKAHLQAAEKLQDQIERTSAKAEQTEEELARLYASDHGAREWGNQGVDASVLAKLPGGK